MGGRCRGRRALGPVSAGNAEARTVVIVTDVTPYLRDTEAELVRAFLDLRDQFPLMCDWRLARLGDPPGPPRPDLAALIPDLAAAYRRHDLIRADTIQSLRRSMDGIQGPGIVVYLADWNAEDENGLEPLIADLRQRKLRFNAIGSEGCFGRPWRKPRSIRSTAPSPASTQLSAVQSPPWTRSTAAISPTRTYSGTLCLSIALRSEKRL